MAETHQHPYFVVEETEAQKIGQSELQSLSKRPHLLSGRDGLKTHLECWLQVWAFNCCDRLAPGRRTTQAFQEEKMKARVSTVKYWIPKGCEENVDPNKEDMEMEIDSGNQGIQSSLSSWTMAELLQSPSAVTFFYDPQNKKSERV